MRFTNMSIVCMFYFLFFFFFFLTFCLVSEYCSCQICSEDAQQS